MRVAFQIVLLLLGPWGFAQQYHYSLRNYKAMDGLPQSQVKIILEDKNGYLWIGTEGGGLARFDGRTFKVFTTLDGLQSNIVDNLMLDKNQQLWIGHPRGISKFNGVSFQKFEQPGSRTSATRLRRIFEFQDTIFFMSSPGYIGKIHHDSVHYWSKPLFERKEGQMEQLISFARKANDSTMIFNINRRMFYCRKGKDNFWIRPKDEYKAIFAVFEYEGDLWLQTDKGFWSLDLNDRTLRKQMLPIKNDILHYDHMQKVFWTFFGNSLLKESFVGDKVRTDTVLRDVDVSQVLVDSEGNTWLGSNGNGLYKYFVQDFDRCGSSNLTNVMAIYHDKEGANWIGSMTRGLFKIKKGKIKTYFTPREPRKNSIYSITESPDGELYIGGAFGVAKYDRAKDAFEWKTFDFGNRRPGVISVQFDDAGGMWLSLLGAGVNHLHGDKSILYSVENGLNSNMIMSLHYSRYHKKTFLGDEFGLTEISNGVVTPTPIEGLGNTSVIAIKAYRDSLLLLSTGGSGMVVYNPETKFKKFITTKEGLASDFIYFVAPDEKDLFWIGSEKGISRVSFDKHFNVTGHLHYDYDNGLTGVEANQNAFCFYDSNKFFGVIDGLYAFNDYERNENRAFDLHLTKVELFYGEYDIREYADSTAGFFNIPVNLSLPPERNHISFHFNKVDKRYPKSLKFKYYLQGFDKTWSMPSSLSEVTYSNLPPGDYTFMVVSTTKDGTWEQNPLAYKFSIKSPFYAKTSFIIGMILLLGAMITIILYMRVRQRIGHMMMLERIRAKEQETVRKDIARDFHDEMGNQLTRIINYISLLKMNGHSTIADHQDLYTKVEQSAKYLYTGTRDFIWSIDPNNDELSKLFIHIRDFGEKLFEEKNISFRAINMVKDNIKIPYGFSREANLIFKEAMTNAFKYSQAKNVTLSLKEENDGLLMSLEDDGVGYDLSQCSRTEGGLKNIQERSEKINVRLNLISIPDEGTTVSIRFKNTKKLQHGITI